MRSWLAVLLVMGQVLGPAPIASGNAAEPAMATTEVGVTVGDPIAGERLFRRCAPCHDIGPGAVSKAGPVLTGVVGRPAADVDGFDYSDAMRRSGARGLVWTRENLAGFLGDPKGFVPGTRMDFAGLGRERQRADLIAFLATFPK